MANILNEIQVQRCTDFNIGIITKLGDDSAGTVFEVIQKEGEPVVCGPEDALLSGLDVLLVASRDTATCTDLMRTLRSGDSIFLKSLGVISMKSSPELGSSADDAIELASLHEHFKIFLANLLSIRDRVRSLRPLDSHVSPLERSRYLLLQFMMTREALSLNPVMSPSSATGYSYPLVACLLREDCGGEMEFLKGLEEDRLINGQVVDRVQLCERCRQYNIRLRRTCPACHSPNVRSEKMLQHLSCGFVGGESTFMDGASLVCPKCRQPCKEVGHEYIVLPEAGWCGHCERLFSDFREEYLCFSCGVTLAPENLVEVDIKKYFLTNAGRAMAGQGAIPEKAPVYSMSMFKEIFRLEARKCRRYKMKSVLHILSALGQGDEPENDAKAGVNSLLEVCESVFRDSDAITVSDQKVIVLLSNADRLGAMSAAGRLHESLRAQNAPAVDVRSIEIFGSIDNVDYLLD
ncbi:MAG: hypothetical protein ACLGPL_10435 [Acidobacteriota bacterium]